MRWKLAIDQRRLDLKKESSYVVTTTTSYDIATVGLGHFLSH